MDNEILDAPDTKPETTYTDKAQKLFFRSVLIYGVIIGLILISRSIPLFLIQLIIGACSFFGMICSISGFKYSTKNLVKKEDNNLKKWFFLVGNLFFSIVFVLIFVNHLRYFKFALSKLSLLF